MTLTQPAPASHPPASPRTAASSERQEKVVNVLGVVGWLTRASVYLVVAVIVAKVALSDGTESEQPTKTGVLNAVLDWTGGTVLVALLGVGAIAYVLVRAAPLVLYRQASTWKQRGQAAAAAVLYLPLAYGAFRLLQGDQLGSSLAGDEGQANGIGGWLLGQPWGKAVLVAAGVGFVGYAAFQAYKAVSGRFLRHLDVEGSMLPVGLVRFLGTFGFLARGVIAALLGTYALRAAAASDPTSVHSLDGALRDIVNVTWGTALLLVVAAGLVAFAGYCSCAAFCREHEEG
jgi:hypothetical protein